MFLCFASSTACEITQTKLLPVLDELARAEFGPMCFYGDVDDAEAQDTQNSIDIVLRIVDGYMRGLRDAYLGYGRVVTEETLRRSQSQSEPKPETRTQEPT